MDKFDVIIIGGGPGGYVAAIKAAQVGLKTLIIEKQWWGGVCLNIGCIPTKALLKSAKVLNYFKHAKSYGVDVNATTIKPNWDEMQIRKSGVVKKLTQGVEHLLKKNQVEKVFGEAKIIDKNTVEVNGKRYAGNNLIIATGSVSRVLDLPGFKEAKENNFLITSRQILSLKEIPKKLTIIGGGVIGIEFACLFSTLGTEVTIVQGVDKILELLDNDISLEMTKVLKSMGVKLKLNAKITAIKDKTLVFMQSGQEKQLTSDFILISVGRVPVIKGLEALNLELGPRKNIKINDRCQTNVENIYAIGDVAADKMLAHVASAQGIVAVENILGKNSKMDMDYIASCIYSFPEIASVGLTEQQCQDKQLSFSSFKFPLLGNGKALADGEITGFAKILANKQTGEIYGAHIISGTATDMITEVTTTMVSEGTIYELAKTIHPHPTLSEVVMEAAHGIIDKPIHG
ncbi:dihydrolipoyl dehydrogenase [Spiroplasma endosymbiont of Lonchoptera lutea]|uniref:dihydrolipoyl dehydrogenase n=1 Tax=Spiroplasma endosymbiont of Lonchoptera lutea TaxID=3066297 RepID=UPI0030CBD5FA